MLLSVNHINTIFSNKNKKKPNGNFIQRDFLHKIDIQDILISLYDNL